MAAPKKKDLDCPERRRRRRGHRVLRDVADGVHQDAAAVVPHGRRRPASAVRGDRVGVAVHGRDDGRPEPLQRPRADARVRRAQGRRALRREPIFSESARRPGDGPRVHGQVVPGGPLRGHLRGDARRDAPGDHQDEAHQPEHGLSGRRAAFAQGGGRRGRLRGTGVDVHEAGRQPGLALPVHGPVAQSAFGRRRGQAAGASHVPRRPRRGPLLGAGDGAVRRRQDAHAVQGREKLRVDAGLLPPDRHAGGPARVFQRRARARGARRPGPGHYLRLRRPRLRRHRPGVVGLLGLVDRVFNKR
mmetsp:Transcript_17088/g.52551  ORF Transcript_17088/g.52551 Transcript_17088/m.52551 type:complete len:302 (+) Transcript_17088:155-1060(+)